MDTNLKIQDIGIDPSVFWRFCNRFCKGLCNQDDLANKQEIKTAEHFIRQWSSMHVRSSIHE